MGWASRVFGFSIWSDHLEFCLTERVQCISVSDGISHHYFGVFFLYPAPRHLRAVSVFYGYGWRCRHDVALCRYLMVCSPGEDPICLVVILQQEWFSQDDIDLFSSICQFKVNLCSFSVRERLFSESRLRIISVFTYYSLKASSVFRICLYGRKRGQAFRHLQLFVSDSIIISESVWCLIVRVFRPFLTWVVASLSYLMIVTSSSLAQAYKLCLIVVLVCSGFFCRYVRSLSEKPLQSQSFILSALQVS